MTKKEPAPRRRGTPTDGRDAGQSAPPCAIATGHLNGTVRVAVVGEIDIVVRDQLRDALAAALCARPAVELVVDLAATTFLDAGGIGVLVRAQHEARRAGRLLRITNPQHPTVRRVLDVTGTLRVLTEPGKAQQPAGQLRHSAGSDRHRIG
jgi:anti-anti-sigma factor